MIIYIEVGYSINHCDNSPHVQLEPTRVRKTTKNKSGDALSGVN